VLLSFITVACTLIGISSAEKGIAFTGVGVGFLSLATTLLSYHHELMIAHLFSYQKSLIESCNANLGFPIWHNLESKRIANTRNMRDWAQLALHFILVSVSLYISWYREFTSPTPPEGLHIVKSNILLLSGLSGFASLIIIFITMLKREAIYKGEKSK
jgi:hypothetical protein